MRVLPTGVRLGILDSLCVINPIKRVMPKYLFWSLSADYLAAQYGGIVKGAALPQLSVGRVRSLRTILPPENEQVAIIENLNTVADAHLQASGVIQSEIDTLIEFKQTLIANAVTGKIKI